MKKRKLVVIKREPIKHFFKCEDGFMVRNLRFNFRWAKWDPPGQRLRIQIWLPLIHIVRDSCKWEIGNGTILFIFHYP